MLLRSLLAALLAAIAVPALATPQPRNATDMWFNAAESGWGLNLIHQGNTLFGTLFVFGPDGQPRWYVASDVAGGPSSYSGVLSECAGSYFGATFDTRALSCRPVGTLGVNVGDAGAAIDYSVDGVHVTKQVTRFTFRPVILSGLYRAYVYQQSPLVRRDLERFSLLDDGARVTVDSSSDSESGCAWNGAHGQDGQVVAVAGTFSCGSAGSAGTGNWSMRADPAPSGFVGSFSGGSASAGRIAGALFGPPKLEGNGWRNGMWFVPSESGWGVNLIEQGDTIFATLFVYDAQGKPHWYVASQLLRTDVTLDGTAINEGPLFEATGPYFGAGSFDPASVTRRQVGSMFFQVHGPGMATLVYTVDNVRITKTVTPFTFSRNDPSGAYTGQITGDNGHDPADITIADQNGSFSMRISGTYGGSTCNYTGTSQQVGEAINASGTLQCTASGTATFVLKNLTVSYDGVTGRVELGNISGFVQEGLTAFNFAGARTTAN